MRHDSVAISKRARVADYAIQQARLEEIELEKKRWVLGSVFIVLGLGFGIWGLGRGRTEKVGV